MTQSARGTIDNRPVIWIVLILAAIGGWKYLEITGALPAGRWDRVPGIWKALLAATGILIVAGAIALFVAGRVEGNSSWEPGRRPRLEIKEGGLSGGWGRYEVIPDSVLVDGQVLAGSTRNARKLLPLLQQAIAETNS